MDSSTNTKSGSVLTYLVLGGCAIVAALVYLGLVPQAALTGNESRAILYLVLGWVPYTIVFYGIGRLFTSPEQLPNMRAADIGLATFLLLLLLSLGLDAWGFTPEQVPEAHVLQAVGIFLGLALFGWGLGRRSNAIMAADSDAVRTDQKP
ncbi:uncharacterized protein Nmag_3731 (plasmid) [Natrialba magadii ATCC 43099]|uniref:Uncharacterized protein n=1 Tax=Natrialba magadii (strain ATCC 43099 / DSM 3394 / CCM 3739 / CIP 104546 / IAM 13178 / JCM 8861 / NBRC 102185 / NCIMB 2190 / MS3) TaxID=547559 RepID=D3T114_NATMM|nr:hypothetical protein [Natrialba magadii]ADD07273.1 uncharacterized protein Nmag_3731 [Natrialba magadii ATCC 43099]ELY34382.1 hypothetical protein C500_00567 [Natrialba magadii ATCC 43099]